MSYIVRLCCSRARRTEDTNRDKCKFLTLLITQVRQEPYEESFGITWENISSIRETSLTRLISANASNDKCKCLHSHSNSKYHLLCSNHGNGKATMGYTICLNYSKCKSVTRVVSGLIVIQNNNGHAIYLLGIFDGAKGNVANDLLVCTMIPLNNLNLIVQHEHLALRRGLQSQK
jgi:hypothetical protein